MRDNLDKKIKYIYKITNLINGKIYVGQHSTNTNRYYMGSGSELKKAKKEFGCHNFKMEILEHYKGNSRMELSELEKEWIKKLDATNPEVGYNIHITGNGGYIGDIWYNSQIGRKHTEEEKKKISVSNKGKVITENTKSLLRKVVQGKSASMETKQKMSNSHSKDPNAKRHNPSKVKESGFHPGIPVVQLTLEGEFVGRFDSASRAAATIGIIRSARIYEVCRGQRFSCGGYKWVFEKDYNKTIK